MQAHVVNLRVVPGIPKLLHCQLSGKEQELVIWYRRSFVTCRARELPRKHAALTEQLRAADMPRPRPRVHACLVLLGSAHAIYAALTSHGSGQCSSTEPRHSTPAATPAGKLRFKHCICIHSHADVDAVVLVRVVPAMTQNDIT